MLKNSIGTPGESRTPNLLIRSQVPELYPIELRVQKPKILENTYLNGMSKRIKAACSKGYTNLRKIREALCPPNPELLLIATDTEASRASLGT